MIFEHLPIVDQGTVSVHDAVSEIFDAAELVYIVVVFEPAFVHERIVPVDDPDHVAECEEFSDVELDIFRNEEGLYRIPRYQGPYSWEESDVCARSNSRFVKGQS